MAAHDRRFNARSLAALRGICYTSRHAGRPCSGDRCRRHRIRRRRLRIPARIAEQTATAVGVRLDRHLPHVAAAWRSPLLLVRHQPRSSPRPQAPDSSSGARMPDGVRRHTAAAARAFGAARLRGQRLAADRGEQHRAAARSRRGLRRDDRRHRSGARLRLFQHLHLRRRPLRPTVCDSPRRRRGAWRRCARAARRRRRVVLAATRKPLVPRHASTLRAVLAAAPLAADHHIEPPQPPQDSGRRRYRRLHRRNQYPRPVSR